MKNKGILILGVAAVAAGAYYYQSLQQTVKALTAKVANFHFDYHNTESSIFTKIYFDVDIIVNNPTSNPVTVSGMNFSVLHEGKSIATANKTEPVTISPQSTTTFKVKVFASTLSLFRSIQDAINTISSGKGFSFDLVGGVIVPAGIIKIDQKIQVQV